jgi:hypothetical protein
MKRTRLPFIPHPSSLIPHPSSLIPHPSSLIPHPSSLIPHPSSLRGVVERRAGIHFIDAWGKAGVYFSRSRNENLAEKEFVYL